jgi:hypothetical protein
MSEVKPFYAPGLRTGYQSSLSCYTGKANVLFHTVCSVLLLAEEGLDINKSADRLREAAADFHGAAYGGELPHILKPKVGVEA